MRDLCPYTRGLTLDWEELRQARKQNLATVREINSECDNSMEFVPVHNNESQQNQIVIYNAPSTGSFENAQIQAASAANSAALILSKFGKSAQSNVANLLNQYAPKQTRSPASASKEGLEILKF